MTIAHPTAYTFQGVKSNYCMKMSGASTVAVLAEIRVRPTTGRDSPPNCGNGFETARLAFAKGHVIALELGGSDDARNVVPQFEDWQGKQNGEWRQMEMALTAYPGQMMLVEIGYGRSGGQQDFDAMLAAFQSNRLMDWTDERIPDLFRVRVHPNKGIDPSSITNDTQFDAAVAKLAAGGTTHSQDFILGDAMPHPDRGNYIVQHGIGIANDLYDARPTLQRADTPISWLLMHGTIGDIRDELLNTPSVTATEASGFQLMPLILGMNTTTAPKVLRKYHAHAKAGRTVVDEDEITRGVKRKSPPATKKPPKKKTRR